jgi:hypothetical protein
VSARRPPPARPNTTKSAATTPSTEGRAKGRSTARGVFKSFNHKSTAAITASSFARVPAAIQVGSLMSGDRWMSPSTAAGF